MSVKESLSLKLESKAKAEVTKTLTPEEIQTRLTGLDERNQILVTEVASLGYPSNLILAAIDSGCKSADEIIENISGSTGPKPLFVLKKWPEEELDIIDLAENGIFYQTSKGHMIISTTLNSSDKKVFSKAIEDDIFHTSKSFIEEITILVCISATTTQYKSEFGIKIGEFEINFESVVENTQIGILGSFLLKIPTQNSYIFRIFASVTGQIELLGDNFMIRYNTTNTSIFSGTKIGSLSLYLKEGSKVELKGYAIYEGRYEKTAKFFEEDFETKDSFGKFVKTQVVESGFVKNKLCIIGLPVNSAKSMANKYYDLEKCLQEAIKLDSSQWPDPLVNVKIEYIQYIKIFNSAAEIEKGYEEILLLENGEPCTTIVNNKKVLAIKKINDNNSKKLSNLYIEETPNAELIGELFIDANQESLKLYGLYTDKPPFIKNIYFVLTRNPVRVALPPGYKVLSNKEGFAINFASKNDKSFCLFLAYTNYDYIAENPINLLTSISQPDSNYGLVSTFATNSENDSSDSYQKMSTLELVQELLDLEENRIQVLGKDFMMSISAHKPEALVSSAENKGVAYLLNTFSNDFASLVPFLSATLAQNNKTVLQKILTECIFQLLTANNNSSPSEKLKTYESPHSYNNNSEINEEIYFPGASKLIIEFDSQCYTEANCDYVSFYKKPNHEEEIKKFSGQGSGSWQGFEYEGDKVYFYFHSDSSVAYWGYKFTVKPVMKKRMSNRKYNIPAILFILDYFSRIGYSYQLSQFFKKEIVLPLFLLIHNTSDLNIIKSTLDILTRLIIQVEPYHKSLIEILLNEASKLKSLTLQGPNELLISLLSFFCSLHESKTYQVKEKWFLNFVNCYYDMKDLSNPSSKLDSFLFTFFQTKFLKSVEKTYESLHPYNKEPKVDEISFPGADSLEIVFDSASSFDDGDEIFFSKDSEGKVGVVSTEKSNKTITWSNTTKGPDVSITNNNLTITRTNSSG